MKLRTKIICLFTLLITICFLFFFLTVRLFTNRTNRTITESFSTQVIKSAAEEAGAWLEQRISELRIIALSDNATEENLEKMHPYIERLNDTIGSRFGNEWGTLAIGRTDGLGWVSDELTIDVSKREYFKKAMTTTAEFVLSIPVVSKTDKSPIVLICYPLRNQDGETFGFLNGAVSLNKLTQLVKKIDFNGADSWIMNRDGIPYTEPDTYPNTQILSDLTPVLQNTSSAGSRQWQHGAENRTVFFTPIPSADDWFLCSAVDQDTLMKDTDQLNHTIGAAWLLLLGFSVVCCIFLSRSITRPIQLLTAITKSVEKGDVNARSPLTGNDEVSILGKSFNQMLDRLKQLMEQIQQEEKEKRNAEFKVLQAQINPHFLYNTLDTLQWKAYDHDDAEMESLIASLSTFYRISLSKGKGIIPLSREIEHIKNYLNIQQIRFQDLLSYDIQCNVDSELYSIVKITLQPLVENAIQHGMKPKLVPCKVSITIEKAQDQLILKVTDDGVGINPEKLQKLREQLNGSTPEEGFGLYNVHKRLNLVYGSEYGLTLTSEEGSGTCVTVRIPATWTDKEVLENV